MKKAEPEKIILEDCQEGMSITGRTGSFGEPC